MSSSQTVWQDTAAGLIPVTVVTPEEMESAKEVDKAEWRKQRPVFSGVLRYFPRALMEVAHASWLGGQQHCPGEPLHWDRSKSSDEMDALLRHLMEYDKKDDDGSWHLAKAAWRCLAQLEKILESQDES